jgi:hypothetical protein
MKNRLNKKLSILAPLMIIALLLAFTPAWSADNSVPDRSYRLGYKEVPEGAYEKVGFFYGIEKVRVKLKDQETYRVSSYIAAPDMTTSFEGEEFDPVRIPPASIVKLIILDAEVIEIILMQRSS